MLAGQERCCNSVSGRDYLRLKNIETGPGLYPTFCLIGAGSISLYLRACINFCVFLHYIWGLSGMYPAISNISRTGGVAMM